MRQRCPRCYLIGARLAHAGAALACWRSTSTTLLKANHSGMASPERSICLNFVPLSFLMLRPSFLACSAATYLGGLVQQRGRAERQF